MDTDDKVGQGPTIGANAASAETGVAYAKPNILKRVMSSLVNSLGNLKICGQRPTEPAGTTLLPLTPDYDADSHAVYVSHLRHALDDQLQIRNIAITGSYGIGKSSILSEIRRIYPKKTVTISLSTLGNESQLDTGKEKETTTTNRVQKEIVKQLLYREKPTLMRNSRFRRITRFHPIREIWISTLLSTLVLFIVFVTSFADRFINLFGTEHPKRDLAYVILFAFFLMAIFGSRFAFHNRVWIEKLGAGPATIALSNRSDSYFDEYLDEIVYFFEVTGSTIVVFEDLDRFYEPHIFETLRELNTLLNNSKGLKNGSIRFIYALRDSIFEQLGLPDSPTSEVATDAVSAENWRANRTKFFDLVIPVVPFITHRSARDLITSILPPEFGIAADLIDVVAKHITDMRLIKNIHNEFSIFRQKLLTSERRLKGLTPNSLFALIIYKNFHLSDFERIKSGESALDTLYEASRQIIDTNIRNANKSRNIIRRQLSHNDQINTRSVKLGDGLEEYIRRVLRHISPNQTTGFTATIAGQQFSSQDLRTDAFWRKFLEDGGQNTLAIQSQVGYQTLFTSEDVSIALQQNLSLVQWEREDRSILENELTKLEKSKEFLRSSDWKRLYDAPEYLREPDTESASFREIVNSTLKSQLGIEMLASGYLDGNFALYVSEYYGLRVTQNAMNFLLHNVEPEKMAPNFPLTVDDIQAVLRESRPSNLTERSMYNISIVNYLLETNDRRAKRICSSLAKLGDPEQEFITAYLADGAQREALFRLLSWQTEEVFVLIRDAEIDESTRLGLYNAALVGGDDGMSYNTGTDETVESIATYLAEHQEKLPALTEMVTESEADSIVQILGTLAVRIPRIAMLSAPVLKSVIRAHLYSMSVDNLHVALDGETDLALDVIKKKNKEVYEFVLADLSTYLQMWAGPDCETVRDPEQFIPILNDVVGHDPTAVRDVALNAASECRVEALAAIDEPAWQGVVNAGRIRTTFDNLRQYLDRFDLDEHIAKLLSHATAIEPSDSAEEEALSATALQIINASAELLDIDAKLKLVLSLGLRSYLSIERVQPFRGRLIGLLIDNKVVDDNRESFNLTANMDWETREFAISRSATFPGYFVPELVPAEDLERLFSSGSVPDAAKAKVWSVLDEYPEISTQAATVAAEYARVADAAVTHSLLNALLDSGVPSRVVLAILPKALPNMTDSDVLQTLGRLGPPYAGLADGSESPVDLPNTDTTTAIGSRLKAAQPPWNTRTLPARDKVRFNRPR